MKNYTLILGESPSKGARSPILWNKTYEQLNIDQKMYPKDIIPDDFDNEIVDKKSVSLMTVHLAKGLEFKNIYIIGLEEDLFPSAMSINSREEIEEERRLFYVAMTRAKEKLILSHCEQRFKWGNIIDCEPSRFISEIDPSFLNNVNRTNNYIKQKIDESKFRLKKLPQKNLKKLRTNPISPLKNPILNINLNEKVYHERFGEGIVQDIEGEGDNIRANINFKISG